MTTRLNRSDWLAMLGTTALGFLIRLIGLAEPVTRVFDESFYARDACLYARLSQAVCAGSQHAEVHPPLGKWLIAAGIRAAGYNPIGWRIASLAAGTITIALVYVLGKRLLRSTFMASLVATLMALDVLHFVLSRVAMLDVFVTMFSVAAFALLAGERARALCGRPPSATLRACVGVACGAAVASKWSGLLTLLAAIWLVLAWSCRTQEGTSSFQRLGRAIRSEAGSIGATLIAVPTLTYLVTFIGVPMRGAEEGLGNWLAGVWALQGQMLDFHRQTVQTTIASSPAWSWPLIRRPVPLFVTEGATIREIWFGGNPLVWWPALFCLLYLLIRWCRRQDPADAAGFILIGFGLLYLPWLALTSPPFTWGRSLVFIFYLLPALPFLPLAIGRTLQQVGSRKVRQIGAAVIITVAAGGFAFLYPILTGQPISRKAWAARVGWFSDCDRPAPHVLLMPDPRRPGSTVRISVPSSDPPTGWCWE